ncbi:hypothetical protein FM104_11685 [Microbacterium esteraromaticum]|uniref:Tryptophan-rich sensory protein n=1 Tax=Microbacterium esteraromaticum TaxID=57043 RepID=A0A1R4KCA6_9MICO|nr:tryptophan-rich sensory protein [Microbacterium esteraromaticum]SJN41868.1 hypothetical protein FM104_11685 [Microbacterium esteraromaticum]
MTDHNNVRDTGATRAARRSAAEQQNASRPHDLARQIVIISTTVFMLIAAVIGAGVLGGTPVQDLQDGALGADGSYLAPAKNAFSIWSAIYIGLIAYAIWQALPSQRANARQRAIGWWIALTMVLNGLWLVTAQFLTLFLTVVVMVLLLVALAYTFRLTVVVPRERWTDAVLIGGVTGLHLGWVTLATVANVSAWLTQIVPQSWADAAAAFGVTVLIVVGLIGLAIGWLSRGRIMPAVAISWGLTWLAVGRLTGKPASDTIGMTAIVVAIVVLVGSLVFLVVRRRTPLRSF